MSCQICPPLKCLGAGCAPTVWFLDKKFRNDHTSVAGTLTSHRPVRRHSHWSTIPDISQSWHESWSSCSSRLEPIFVGSVAVLTMAMIFSISGNQFVQTIWQNGPGRIFNWGPLIQFAWAWPWTSLFSTMRLDWEWSTLHLYHLSWFILYNIFIFHILISFTYIGNLSIFPWFRLLTSWFVLLHFADPCCHLKQQVYKYTDKACQLAKAWRLAAWRWLLAIFPSKQIGFCHVSFHHVALMCESVFVESFCRSVSAAQSPFLDLCWPHSTIKVRQEAFENAMGDLDSLDAEQHPLQQDISWNICFFGSVPEDQNRRSFAVLFLINPLTTSALQRQVQR